MSKDKVILVKGGEVSQRRSEYLLSIGRMVIMDCVDGVTKYYVAVQANKRKREVH
ncbi:hypothetical protein EalM132_00151 [Exiguobacterium phage vB_EalM-132]|nr:hypothetical protein EalM132_00151 [Exiguobacterium phage vB_EalM-132]